MKHLITCDALLAAGQALADEDKYVGVWEGNFDTPIYTKLVMKPEASLTYCEVSSCRQVNCMDMAYSGTFEGTFEHQGAFGKYVFTRISDEEFEGVFTHVLGDVSYAYYEPE